MVSKLKYLSIVVLLLCNILSARAATGCASSEMSFIMPEYLKVESVTSPVLIANITDRTGNLHAPLSSRFKVISNSGETKRLYLRSSVNVEGGREDSMFQQGGQIYIAFANVSRIPTVQALNNCKMGSSPKDSPGIVAYPVTSITGAKGRYIRGGKYEMDINKGITYIDVNIGSNVLKTSFAANDRRGCYQAILSLTESDI